MDTPQYEVNSLLDRLMESLQVLTKSSRVVGEPIIVGEYTLVPLIHIGFGFGGGGGGGEDSSRGNSRGSGEGGGAGGSIQPIALLVLRGDEIHLYALPLSAAFGGAASGIQELVSKKSALSELVASIPDVLSRLKKKKNDES